MKEITLQKNMLLQIIWSLPLGIVNEKCKIMALFETCNILLYLTVMGMNYFYKPDML